MKEAERCLDAICAPFCHLLAEGAFLFPQPPKSAAAGFQKNGAVPREVIAWKKRLQKK
jgi:hypothetical protein